MIEASEFPPCDAAAAAWRSFKLNVDQSPLVFALGIWLPLTARTLSLLGQIIDEGHRLRSVCLRPRGHFFFSAAMCSTRLGVGSVSHAALPSSRGSKISVKCPFLALVFPLATCYSPNPPFTFPLFEMRGAANFSGSRGEYSCQK